MYFSLAPVLRGEGRGEGPDPRVDSGFKITRSEATIMPIEVKLPNLGEGVESGDILDVLVNEGDTIAKDQAILEIETGKATMQVPSDFAGKIVKLHVSKGQTVKNGAVLLTLEGAGGGAAAPAAPAGGRAGGPPPEGDQER